jgi:hypothetical protein
MYIHGYTSADGEPTFNVPENFDRYQEGSGWQAYKGANDWESGTTGVAVYLNPEGYQKDQARIWFEIAFPKEMAEAVHSSYNSPHANAVKKWGDKATRKWIRETARIHKASRHQIIPNGRFFYKKWGECFLEALQSEIMKPFVKKFGVDKTKWVGMKRCVNESGFPSKFWWMDKDTNLIPVPGTGHAQKGGEILDSQFGVRVQKLSQVYPEMFKRGFIRLGFAGMMGQYFLELNYDKTVPPNSKQWKAVKDLAIEMGAEVIDDQPSRRTVRVDESRMLFENFHENKEWFIYEGDNTITAVFEDNSRQTFKVHFRDNRGEDKLKHRTKAARTWKKLAMEMRKTAGLSKVGNPVVIPWQECFQKSLDHPEMREYVDDLRSTPIFEWIDGSIKHYWLSRNGEAVKVTSHDEGGVKILASQGFSTKGYQGVYDAMYKLGFARVIVGDSEYPLAVDTGTSGDARLSNAQKRWLQDKSFELGLRGEYYNAMGREVTAEGINEMSYDDLRQSMKNYKVRRGGMGKTAKVGDNGREERSQHVRVKPLRITSTVGKDKQERETSLFSYNSEIPWRTGGASGHGHQGYIRFLENFQKGGEGDVEVNCTCGDYKYVWAKANNDAGAGPTRADGKLDTHGQFKGGSNDNDGTYGKKIRNPSNVPGLCKHLIALAEYLEVQSSPVAPADPDKKEPSQVAPASPSKPKRPVNIFEAMKQFALTHPQFTVQYED